MNLNELAYRLKEQGLSYTQIGFILQDQEKRKELCSAFNPGTISSLEQPRTIDCDPLPNGAGLKFGISISYKQNYLE